MNSAVPSLAVSDTARPVHVSKEVSGQAGVGADRLMITEIRTIEGFSALAPEWRALLQESNVDCMFLTWEWLYTWWKCLAGPRRLLILAIHRQNALVGIAPFAVRSAEPARVLPFRAVEFLGVGSVGSDYLDLILRKGEEDRICAGLADYMADWHLMLDMRRVAIGTANVERLARELAGRGWTTIVSDDDICLYLPLSGTSWETCFAGLSREFRRSLRRGRRNAESAYAVTYRSVSREEDRAATLQAFIRLHNKRWKGRDGTQALPDNSIIWFHEQWSRIALERGWLRLSTLFFDQTPVAGTYGFAYGGKFYFYLSGFDPAYAAYGAGRMCMEVDLREAFREGLKEYDFLHGDENYKYHWARDFRALGRYRVFPPGFRGRASRWLLDAREGCKSLVGRGHGKRGTHEGGRSPTVRGREKS